MQSLFPADTHKRMNSTGISPNIRNFRRILFCALAIFLVVFWVHLCRHPNSDFPNHWLMGKYLAHGQFIYPNGFNEVYPPFWALAHAPFTIVDFHVAMAVLYPFGVAAIAGLVILLLKLAQRHWPLEGDRLFWVTLAAMLLAGPFLDRDLSELGVNTFLALLTWWGIYLWVQGRDELGGISIGLAIALKCTAAIFIAYFLWKRQWKIACSTAAAALGFSLLPLVFMGTQRFMQAERAWVHVVLAGLREPDPSISGMGIEKDGNLSLKPALARYLMRAPDKSIRTKGDADELGPDDPLYVQFLDLPAKTAGIIVKIILLSIAAATAWLFRKRIVERDEPALLMECAAISMAALLYSPITWGQHCGAALPAIYFILRARSARDGVPRWATGCLVVFFILNVVFMRGFIQGYLSSVRDSYHLRSFSLLLVFFATLGCHGVRGAAEPALEHPGNSLPLGSPA